MKYDVYIVQGVPRLAIHVSTGGGEVLIWVVLCCCTCRFEEDETSGEGDRKTGKTIVTLTLIGDSAEVVDSYIADAYNNYREALQQNVAAKKGPEKR